MSKSIKIIYLAVLDVPVDGDTWVEIADDIETKLKASGWDAWGINNQAIDRDFMAAKSDLTVIEGMLDGGADTLDAERVISSVLSSHGASGKITFQ